MYELLFKIICLELGKIRVTHNPVPGVENINSENNKSNQLTKTTCKKITIKSGRLLHSNTTMNDFHLGVHKLLMSLKTWASGKVQYLRVTQLVNARRASWNSNISPVDTIRYITLHYIILQPQYL